MLSRENLERIYDEHAEALYAFLCSYTRNTEDARDVLQEVFVKVAREWKRYEVRSERNFLLQMGYRTMVDFMRRRETRTKYEDRFAVEVPELFAPTDDPDVKVFRDELGRALGAVPLEQREVLHLKLWEGLTFEEVGGVLGISQNTAASRYRYGLDKLRELLRPVYKELL